LKQPFFIVGPTGIGKTAAAIALAEAWNAEIVNADAFQIYAGLDLLSGKPSREEAARVTHHLLSSVPLAEPYHVARFLEEAARCLAGIEARGRRAIVAGGSGMYIKALTHGLAPLPPAQPELRASLETLEPPALLARLAELDPEAAAAIDGKNKRRLVRAVEVCVATGGKFSATRSLWEPGRAAAGIAGVFLRSSRADLHARIKARVERMFAQGVVEEVAAIPASAIGPTAQGMIGLAEVRRLLAGELTRAECISLVQAATRQYAKRQITWFKRETVFTALDADQDVNQAIQSVAARTWPG
jgi:tRNA dimethylallyltransferase